MKLSNLFYLGALSALVLTGCKDNDDNSEWMTDGVVFTSHIEGMVSRASGSAWSDGDKVGIYMSAGGTDFENYEYTASADGALTAAGKTLKYPEEGTADFFAYYPYQSGISGKTYAVDVTDQSDPTKIDLLYATKTGISNGEAVNFAFSHQLSQIVINVSHDETIASLNGLKIQVKGMNTQASFALADGTLTPTDNKTDFAMNVNAEGTTAEAIVIPTADLTGAELVFTLADGKSFGWDLTQSDVSSFDKGTKYTYNASLSMTNGQPSADMGNATIDDWTTKPGGDINVDFGEGTQTGGEVVVLDEPFADGQGDFTIEDKTKPEELSYVWNFSSGTSSSGDYHYMKASAHVNETNYAAESWLVSPAVDLTQATTATLTFTHIINFGKDLMSTNQTLWVSEANTENWEQVTIPTYPDGNSWNEAESGDIDLSKYAGKTIKLGFKYVSTTSSAATWEVYNVKVVANGGSGTVDPNPDPDPEPTPTGSELYISEYVEGSSNNKYLELYNPTDQAIDLSQYALDLNTNGGSNWSNDGSGFKNYTELSGTLAAKSTIVYKNANAEIYDGEATECSAVNFNGNDPIGLFKNGKLIDIVGTFNGGSADFAKDVTLRRKASVNAPSTTYNPNDWDELSKDDISGLGQR